MWNWIKTKAGGNEAPRPPVASNNAGMFSFGGTKAYAKQNESAVAPKDYDALYKLLLIGDSGVGKSSLLLRFADDTFTDSFISTIGVDFKVRSLQLGEKMVKLQCWDTSGQERFRTITSSYYRGAHGILVCFDLTDKTTFTNITQWTSEIDRYACENVNVLICGCKADLKAERAVSREEINTFCATYGFPYVETSAKADENCFKAFATCASFISARFHGSKVDLKSVRLASVNELQKRQEQMALRSKAQKSAADESDDDDLEASCESFSAEDLYTPLQQVALEKKSKSTARSKHMKYEKADVNVFRLELSKLNDDVPLVTGDPFSCEECGAMFSNDSVVVEMTKKEFKSHQKEVHQKYRELVPAPPLHAKFAKFIPGEFVKFEKPVADNLKKSSSSSSSSSSKKKKKKKSKKESKKAVAILDDNDAKDEEEEKEKEEEEDSKLFYWMCDFCGAAQESSDFDHEHERPPNACIEYLVETAPKTKKSKKKKSSSSAAEKKQYKTRVFCIDTSGSMCVTTEVQGRHEFKGSEKRDKMNAELAQDGGIDISRLPDARRAVTHVSRLQCIQAAVSREIEREAREHPDTKVIIIAFSDNVTVFGDGLQPPAIVAGSKLDKLNDLIAFAKAQPEGKSVSEANDALSKCLWGLEENGATALGPALRIAIELASRGAPGSTMTLCTDGLANLGVGSLDENSASGRLHYVECAEHAKLAGVACSVVSLIGSECKLEALSVVAEQTGGSVERINAVDLLKGDFGALLNKPIVAHGVMAMVVLHRGLRFKGEFDDEAENRNWCVKDLGTVTEESEVAFKYAFRPKQEVDVSDLPAVPFQLQLLYTRKDGSLRMRVATARLETTQDREEAEDGANMAIVAAQVAQSAARHARRGSFYAAQMETRAAQRLMNRKGVSKKKIDMWSEKVDALDQTVAKKSRAAAPASSRSSAAENALAMPQAANPQYDDSGYAALNMQSNMNAKAMEEFF